VTTVPEHFDVLVVGAGVSGIDAGYRLQTECPRKTYAILEARAGLGGTWDLFRFPGIRSDSDMSTLGFPFRPWTGEQSIADGASILRYHGETAAEFGIDRHIRFNQKVLRASWSTDTSTWTVEVGVGDAGESAVYTCSFLYACSGYYSYDSGYTPDLPGIGQFAGTVVHPQAWPEDLDYRNRRVVIIGSGATAVTIVPAMAKDAAKVTMLQRSPSYLLSLPSRDPLLPRLRKHVSESVALRIVRWKNVIMTVAFYQLSRRAPKLTRKLLAAGAAQLLPPDFPIDPHFTPTYDPWDQRMCIVPDGDFFAAVSSGRAEVVTDRIETFTPTGIRLASGVEVPADIVVTATGLNLRAVGGIAMTVDGVAVDPAQRYAYRGFMLSGVPNFAFCMGYVNASWTLRADLSSKSVCKLLNHMDAHGYATAAPKSMTVAAGARPLFDLAAGYIRRGGGDQMPKQGPGGPWRFRQNYLLDAFTARFGAMDQAMEYRVAPQGDSTRSRSVAAVS
jgi:monooxygenase